MKKIEAIIKPFKLEDVKEQDLPESLKKMSASDRKKEVDKRLGERREIRKEILELSKKRDEFIKAERAKIGQQDVGVKLLQCQFQTKGCAAAIERQRRPLRL